jgi:peroxiredoxin (alkyl hydroperoxide reductase subunit C)
MRAVGCLVGLIVSMTPFHSFAQVLGPCGTPDAKKPAAAVTTSQAAAPSVASRDVVSPVPLPGQQAPNFELAALVGDQVKMVKLSDYDGKWRVVCFYPADFTFV